MKILMALNGLDIGGAETHVVELSKELKRRGHDIVMVSAGGVYQKEVEDAGIKHYKIVLNSRDVRSILGAKGKLKKILIDEKPDIVHAHARIPGFLLGSLHKEMKGKNAFVFVTTAHWTFDTSFLVKKLTCWGQKTLAVSDDLKKYLLKYYPEVEEKNIYISINGIDGRKFSKNISGEKVAKEFNLTPGAKRIVYVSRLNPAVCAPAYGIIENIARIDAAVPGVEAIIVGGGDCYDDMAAKAEETNAALGRRAVIMAGPRTDINEIHANADVCVGVSRAILEPMIMEKKCVVAGQEGYIGVLTPDKLDTAIGCNFTCRGCVPLDNAKLSDDIIKLLLTDGAEEKKITDYGKSVVETYYSVKKMADDNYRMYCDALRDCRTEAAILGYYGYGNSGDDALLRAVINDMKKVEPTFAPVVLSHTPSVTEKRYGVKSVDRFSVSEVIRTFKNTGLLIVGGGSLIQDITSTKSLLYYLWCIRTAKRMGLKVMLYANGIGPLTKESNKRKAAKVLSSVDVITLRDVESAKLLSDIGVTKPRVEITADPAFSLEACAAEKTAELLSSFGVKGDYFCMSVRNWGENSDEVMRNLASLGDHIAKSYSLTPLFIPMQYEHDLATSRKIMSMMHSPSAITDRPLDTESLIGIIGGAKAAVAVRLHMLIFAAVSAVPSLGIEYDPKVASFQKYIGQPYCIKPDKIGTDGIRTADEFMKNLDKVRAELEAALPELKEKAYQNAVIAEELINERK